MRLKKGRKARRNRLRGARGRGTLEKEKHPVFGMIKRRGELVINMLHNVQQKTIQPIIKASVEFGTFIFTDEYSIYDRLLKWDFYIKVSTMERANLQEMRMEMDSVRFMLTQSRVYDLYYIHG